MITDVNKIPEKILARMFIPAVVLMGKHERTLTENQIAMLTTKEERALAFMASEYETAIEHWTQQLIIHVNATRLVEARNIQRWDTIKKWAVIIVPILIGALATKFIHP